MTPTYSPGDMLKYLSFNVTRYYVVLNIVEAGEYPIYKLFDIQDNYYRHVYCHGEFSRKCIRVA